MNACQIDKTHPVVYAIAEELGIPTEEALHRIRDYQAATGKQGIPTKEELKVIGATYAAMRIFTILENPKFRKVFEKALEFKQPVDSVLKSWGVPQFYVDEFSKDIEYERRKAEAEGKKFTIEDLKRILYSYNVYVTPVYNLKETGLETPESYLVLGYNAQYAFSLKTNTIIDVKQHPFYLAQDRKGIAWVRIERNANYDKFSKKDILSRILIKNNTADPGRMADFEYGKVGENSPFIGFYSKTLSKIHGALIGELQKNVDYSFGRTEKKERFDKIDEIASLFNNVFYEKDLKTINILVDNETYTDDLSFLADEEKFKQIDSIYFESFYLGFEVVFYPKENKFNIQYIKEYTEDRGFYKDYHPKKSAEYFTVVNVYGTINEDTGDIVDFEEIEEKKKIDDFFFENKINEVREKKVGIKSPRAIDLKTVFRKIWLDVEFLVDREKLLQTDLFGDTIVLSNIQTDLRKAHDKDPIVQQQRERDPYLKYLLYKDRWVDIALQEAYQHARATNAKRIIIPSGEIIAKKWGLEERSELANFYNKTVLKKAKNIYGNYEVKKWADLTKEENFHINIRYNPEDVVYIFHVDPEKPLKPLYYHLTENEDKYRDRLREIYAQYVNEDGFIPEAYVEDVGHEIKDIPDTVIKVTRDGKKYIDSPYGPSVNAREGLVKLLDKLSEQYGIKYVFDRSLKAKGAFDGEVVRINPDYATEETAIHEFAHPFIKAVKQQNPSLYKRMVRTVQRIGTLDEVKEKYKDVYTNEEDFVEEAIVTALGRYAVLDNASKTIFQKFIDWINNIIRKLFGRSFNSLGDLYHAFETGTVENTPLDQLTADKVTYYQLDTDTASYLMQKIQTANELQKETIKKVAAIATSAKLDESGQYYVTNKGFKLKRVTEWLNEFDYYRYEGVSDEDALAIGTDVDKIAEAAVLGKPMPEYNYVSDEVAKRVYEDFVKWRQDMEKEGNIIIPQVTLYDESAGVAGTADFIIIDKEGKIHIKDLKTSKHFFATHRRKYPGKKKADTYDKHDAQLTAYMALAESKGLEMGSSDTLSVLGYTIERDDNNKGIEVKDFKEIKHSGDKFIYTQLGRISKKDELQVLENLKLVLQKKLMLAEKAGNRRQVEALRSLIEHITLDIPVEAITNFVNEAATTFMGSKNFAGYYDFLNRLITEAKAGTTPIKEALNDIHRVSEYVDMYLPSLLEIRRELSKYYDKEPFDNVEENSVLDKLDKTINTLQMMRNTIRSEGAMLIAQELAKHVTPTAIEGLKKMISDKEKEIQRLEERLAKKPGSTYLKSKIESQKEKLNFIKQKFVNEKGEVDMTKALYIEITQGGYQDTSFVDRFLYSAVNSPTLFMSAFALTLKKSFEEARIEALDLLPKATKLYRDYAKKIGKSIDRPDKVNEKILEKRVEYVKKKDSDEYERREVLALISPIDYNKFNENKNNLSKQLKQIEDKAVRQEVWQRWMAENVQVRPEKHIEGVTKIGDLVLIETLSEFEARKKREMGEMAFKKWKARMTKGGRYRGEYLIPRLDKYANQRFKSLDDATREYYVEVMKMYLEAQENVPHRQEKDKFILPYISKSINDRALEHGIYKAGKYAFEDSFTLLNEDLYEENIQRERILPVLYWNNSYGMNADEASKDVVQSVLRFSIAAKRYKAKKEYLGLANMLEDLVSQTTPLEILNDRPLYDKAAKELGIEGIQAYAKKQESNAAALLTAFIEKNIYEIHRKDPVVHLAGRTIDVGKVANSFMKLASIVNIAFKPLTAVANSLTAQLQIAEEAYAGQYIDTYTYRKAHQEYLAHEGDMMRDFVSPYNKSFIGQLFDLYEPLQGEMYDEFGRRVSKSALKAHFDTSIGFIGMHKGEHRAAMTMLIAQLMKKKMSDGRSLYDHLKERYKKNGKLTKEDYDFEIASRVHAINKQLHGIYDRFNSPDILRNFVGRLLLMYRKFLYPGIKRRFGGEYFDLEAGAVQKGFMRVFYQKLFTDTKAIIDAFKKRADTLTEPEMYAVRRALMEHFIVLTTGLLAYALIQLGFGDDDDDESKFETWAESLLLYEVLRVNAEISVFGSPGDPNDYFLPDPKEMLNTFKQVSAAYSMLNKIYNVFTYAVHDAGSVIIGEDIARYERDTGLFNKGDSKLAASIIKLLGMNGYTLHPEEALKTLFVARGVDVKTTK